MKRSPLARRSGLRRTGRIPARRSADRIALRRAAVAAARARDGYRCRAADLVLGVTCAGELDGHEPLMRSRGGDPLNPDHIVTLCRRHHDWVHGNPAKATALGLLVHAWERTDA